MAGTILGGSKTAQKNLERDPDFYRKIGAMGGKKSKGGGFTMPCSCNAFEEEHLKARCSGKKSKRTKKS